MLIFNKTEQNTGIGFFSFCWKNYKAVIWKKIDARDVKLMKENEL
jgi:hypothetical protein